MACGIKSGDDSVDQTCIVCKTHPACHVKMALARGLRMCLSEKFEIITLLRLNLEAVDWKLCKCHADLYHLYCN